MEKKKKSAILVISFGTSYQDTRKKTLDAIEKELKEEFQSFNYQGNYIIYEDVVPIAEDANVERRKRQIMRKAFLWDTGIWTHTR